MGFVDDDDSKIGKTLDGVTVFKLGDKLNKFIEDNNVSKVVISTTKLSKNRLTLLLSYFQKLNVQILELPPVRFWVNGIPNISRLRPIKIEELLCRGVIPIDNEKNRLLYQSKSILVTGAAGSIGSEIVRQVIKFKPAKIVLLDKAETPMFNIKEELDLISNKIKVIYYIDSVSDEKAINN